MGEVPYQNYVRIILKVLWGSLIEVCKDYFNILWGPL